MVMNRLRTSRQMVRLVAVVTFQSRSTAALTLRTTSLQELKISW